MLATYFSISFNFSSFFTLFMSLKIFFSSPPAFAAFPISSIFFRLATCDVRPVTCSASSAFD